MAANNARCMRDSGERRQLAEHDFVGKLPKNTGWQPALPGHDGAVPNFMLQHTRALEARPRFRLPRLDVLAADSRKRGGRATRLFPTEQAREPKLCNVPLL